MCRLLLVHSKKPFHSQSHLEAFAKIAQKSREYQGHGWGCAFIENGRWTIYKSICPIWEDDLSHFKSTNLLLAHARSAFRDEGICIENNMPFVSQNVVFIFNGELHGVRVQEWGRIGAEKLFHFLLRFSDRSLLQGVMRGTSIIQKRTRFIRAMNLIVCDRTRIVLSTEFSDDTDYFTLYMQQSDELLRICSNPYPNENNWQPIPNHTKKEFVL